MNFLIFCFIDTNVKLFAVLAIDYTDFVLRLKLWSF